MDAFGDDVGVASGLIIWRVENFKPVRIATEFHGQFYVGDSYIVLSSIIEGEYKSMNLHFWLGKDSSQDEKGAAAALSARLDELLDDIPIQYREVEGRESSRFLSYFPNGIQYLWGGVASGFNHVEDDSKTRLLHVKGKKKITATEVAVSWDSFNHGDIFVLQHKDQVFQWNGCESNPFERIKACRLANKIAAAEKSGRVKVRIVEDADAEDSVPEGMIDAMGERSTIADAMSDTLTPIEVHRGPAVLFQVSTDSGSLQVNELGKAPLTQDLLKSGDCFLIDAAAANKIFVWKGKEAAEDERKAAMSTAEKFIDQKGYPKETSIEVLPETGESTYFKEYFSDWQHVEESAGLKHFNLRPPKLFSVSDAEGSLRVEEILGSLEQTDLLPKEVCILDCFDKIFVWNGKEASDQEKASAGGVAKKFLETDPRGRSVDTEIRFEEQESESDDFKSYFPEWDVNCFVDPHQVLLDMAEQMRVLTQRHTY